MQDLRGDSLADGDAGPFEAAEVPANNHRLFCRFDVTAVGWRGCQNGCGNPQMESKGLKGHESSITCNSLIPNGQYGHALSGQPIFSLCADRSGRGNVQ